MCLPAKLAPVCGVSKNTSGHRVRWASLVPGDRVPAAKLGTCVVNLLLRSCLFVVVGACSQALASSASATGGHSGSHQSQRIATQAPTPMTGWLFVDQAFVPPPYVVASTVDTVTVNGTQVISADQLRGQIGQRERVRGRRPPRRGSAFGVRDVAYRDREQSSIDELRQHLDQMLGAGSVVIADGDGGLLELYDLADLKYFWSNVLGRDEHLDSVNRIDTRLISQQEWIRGLGDNPALIQAGTAVLAEFNAVTVDNTQVSEAVRDLGRWSYPLTVLGMLLGVLAIGHLLKSAANPSLAASGDPRESRDSINPAFIKATVVSIGLIFAMSMLDLAWTLLASQAGQMRELNPIGARMIDSPALLIVFKAIVTGGACLIFYSLRKHAQTQTAAWWMCLVLCLLTMRWLVFNSLFV